MAKPRVGLKLNGQPLQLHFVPPTVSRLKAILDKSPKDELFTAEQVARRAGISPTFSRSGYATSPMMAGYSHLVSGRRLYGHPAAIVELRRELGANA